MYAVKENIEPQPTAIVKPMLTPVEEKFVALVAQIIVTKTFDDEKRNSLFTIQQHRSE